MPNDAGGTTVVRETRETQIRVTVARGVLLDEVRELLVLALHELDLGLELDERAFELGELLLAFFQGLLEVADLRLELRTLLQGHKT